MFTIELTLGFNGRLLMVGRLPIRYLLFFLVFATSFAAIVELLIKKRVRLNPKHPDSIFKMYDSFDLVLAFFLLLNMIWVVIIPQSSGNSIITAAKEVASLSMLSFYFPAVALIRTGYIRWDRAYQLVKVCVITISIIHIVLYFGEKMAGDATFQLRFFGLIEKLTFGHSQRPIVMMPKNYVRVIYPAAIYFVVFFYFILKSELTSKDMFMFIVAILATFTPLTKSLWFGIGGAMLLYLVWCFIEKRRNAPIYRSHRLTILVITALISTITFNYLLFDNYIFIRTVNTFAIPEEAPNYDDETMILDETGAIDRFKDELEGTKRSNYTRVHQIKVLLAKWRERPLMGHGYGSYVKEYHGDEAAPYSYEMFLPALMMKIGIVGILVWFSFFAYVVSFFLKKYQSNRKYCYTALFIIFALLLSTQFNPYLLNACGMGCLLFALLDLKVGTMPLYESRYQ